MPKMVTQPTLVQCNYCPKQFNTEGECIAHEELCAYRPDIKERLEGKCYYSSMGAIKFLYHIIRADPGEVEYEGVTYGTTGANIQTKTINYFYWDGDKEITFDQYTKLKCKAILKICPDIKDYLRSTETQEGQGQ